MSSRKPRPTNWSSMKSLGAWTPKDIKREREEIRDHMRRKALAEEYRAVLREVLGHE